MSQNNLNLFQEVQEDLERQKLEAFWKKYGIWIIVAALGIVISTATSTTYRQWTANKNQRITAEFLSATKDKADTKTLLESLEKFAAENASSKEAAIALLRAGAAAYDADDKAKAIELFDKVSTDAKAYESFRALGSLLSVQAQLDSGDPIKLSQKLEPLTAEGSVWRYTALEMDGLLAIRAGDKDKAKKVFTTLSRDQNAPRSLASRAADVLRTLD
jgi:hypothetical protein